MLRPPTPAPSAEQLHEVLEDELNRRQRASAGGAAEFLTQSVERLKEKMLVCLEEVELLGEIERFLLGASTWRRRIACLVTTRSMEHHLECDAAPARVRELRSRRAGAARSPV